MRRSFIRYLLVVWITRWHNVLKPVSSGEGFCVVALCCYIRLYCLFVGSCCGQSSAVSERYPFVSCLLLFLSFPMFVMPSLTLHTSCHFLFWGMSVGDWTLIHTLSVLRQIIRQWENLSCRVRLSVFQICTAVKSINSGQEEFLRKTLEDCRSISCSLHSNWCYIHLWTHFCVAKKKKYLSMKKPQTGKSSCVIMKLAWTKRMHNYI